MIFTAPQHVFSAVRFLLRYHVDTILPRRASPNHTHPYTIWTTGDCRQDYLLSFQYQGFNGIRLDTELSILFSRCRFPHFVVKAPGSLALIITFCADLENHFLAPWGPPRFATRERWLRRPE